MAAMAPCVRCLQLFEFDPETVPSCRVHVRTRCSVKPDGSMVLPGDPDPETLLEPLCPPCAKFMRSFHGANAPALTLFPWARLDLVDIEAAIRNQASP